MLWLPARADTPAEPFALGVPPGPARAKGPLLLWSNDDLSAGCAILRDALEDMNAAARSVYTAIFEATAGRHLARAWNWVPSINEHPAGGEEIYRLFCFGRAQAFAAYFGEDCEAKMPAGTAVGVAGRDLVVHFVATRAPVHNLENPRQKPAYRYPRAYGPRPPSFARATRIANVDTDAPGWLCISGTAAILGSESLCPGDLEGQLRITLDNLARMGARWGDTGARRFVRVFVRHAADLPRVRERVRTLLTPEDQLACVCADICRKELLLEIEVTLDERARSARAPLPQRPESHVRSQRLIVS
ncbi:MAG: hypothetical protein JJT96_00665 [Opitutales bacterium]|nr:hypothetical protein [Opitutales bacterium]